MTHLFQTIESVATGMKLIRVVPSFEELIEELATNIVIYGASELYSNSKSIAGRFYENEIPISGESYVDMCLDDKEISDGSMELIKKLGKQVIFETTVNTTLQLFKDDMIRHLEKLATEACEKGDFQNLKL